MSTFLAYALTNAVLATGMFAVVMACKSRIRNPAVLHWLWILVLLKFVTPPLWTPTWALLPTGQSLDAVTTAMPVTQAAGSDDRWHRQFDRTAESQVKQPAKPDVSIDRPTGKPPANIEEQPVGGRHFILPSVARLLPLLVGLWATGTCMWWGLAMWRIYCLERCLRFAREASEEIQATTALLAKQLGLRNCPRVWQVPSRVSPMLWAFIGPPRIIIPSDLFSELDAPARTTLLLHELIHFRRGDQWVRWLELLSLGLYWWHPVVWLLRREIRVAEELACDANVIFQRPHDRRTYAEMLVKTVAFLSCTNAPRLATSMSSTGTIEERLKLIMGTARNVRISRRTKALICLLAVLVLPLAPLVVRAQVAKTKPPATRRATTSSPVKAARKAVTAESRVVKEAELVGMVVDHDGNPVTGAEVNAFLDGQPMELTLTTNDLGQFWVPRLWHPEDHFESHAVLVVRRAETHLGWLDLRSLLNRPAKQDPGAAKDPFKIVLLPRSQTVRGKLVDEAGHPLNGIRMVTELLTHPINQAVTYRSVGGQGFAAATSNQNGDFVVHLPAGSRAWLEPDHLDWQRTRTEAKSGANDLGRITLARAGRVQGRITDTATGKPLANQQVFAQAQDTSQFSKGVALYGSAFSDPDGNYTIGGLSPGRYNVLFSGEMPKTTDQPRLTATAAEGVEISLTGPARADFRADKGRRLSGKVLDGESGKPLPKIHVGYYGPARPNSGAACMMVRTEVDGTFEFHVPPGVSKVYVAEDREAHADSSRTLEVPTDRDLVDVVLQAGQVRLNQGRYDFEALSQPESKQPVSEPADPQHYTLQVVLKTPEGRNVNYVEARVIHKGSQFATQSTALSATGSKISFSPWEDGRRSFLLIDADGYASIRSSEFVVAERMPSLTVELVPEVNVPVLGKVVDKNGAPAIKARVRVARLVYGTEQQFPWGLEYLSDDAGRFEIKHARVGDKVKIHIDHPGMGAAETDWLTLDAQQPLTLPDLHVGPPNREVGGIVRDSNGFPVANAKVTHIGESKVETTTDAEGKFRLAGLPTGTVSVAIESDGFPRDIRRVREGKLDNEIYVNRIRPEDEAKYQVTVTLRPRDGREVSRATLYLCVQNGDLLATMPDRAGQSHKLGLASFVPRNQGKEFIVVVAADGYAWPKPVVVPNREGAQAVFIDLEPAAPVTLRGRVVDNGGEPVADAAIGLSISLTDTATDEPWRYLGSRVKLPRSDSDGNFEIPGMLPGSRIAAYINKPGYSGVWSDRVTIDPNNDLKLPVLSLPPATGVITGRVVDERGDPVTDATVFVIDLGRVETSTDQDGRFRLERVPNRETWLCVQAESGEWSQKVTPDASDLKIKLQAIQ